jgi:hypothetical protein
MAFHQCPVDFGDLVFLELSMNPLRCLRVPREADYSTNRAVKPMGNAKIDTSRLGVFFLDIGLGQRFQAGDTLWCLGEYRCGFVHHEEMMVFEKDLYGKQGGWPIL